MYEFRFLELRCKQGGRFSDAGNVITSKSLQSRVFNLFTVTEISALEGTKMKSTIFCLVHSLSRFLAGGKALAG
jgi:hypothetical protein